MNEHKCPKCDNELMWVGNVMDGHMECRTCKEQELMAPVMGSPTKKFEDQQFDYDPAMLGVDQTVERIFHRSGYRRSGRTHKALLHLLESMEKESKAGIYLVHCPQMLDYVLNMASSILATAGYEIKRHHTRGSIEITTPGRSPKLVLYVIQAQNDPRGFARDIKLVVDHACYESRQSGLSRSIYEWRAYHDN